MEDNWVRLELNLRAYKAPKSDPELLLSDVKLATLRELGDNDEARYRLFELNRECSADIPGRGPFHTWEEYRLRRLEVPSFDPRGVSLAVDGDEWVGIAWFTARPKPESGDGYLFSEMTGVVRALLRTA